MPLFPAAAAHCSGQVQPNHLSLVQARTPVIADAAALGDNASMCAMNTDGARSPQPDCKQRSDYSPTHIQSTTWAERSARCSPRQRSRPQCSLRAGRARYMSAWHTSRACTI